MKKLLALVMVLGIASLATAGIDLGTVPGLSYEISGNTVIISGTGVTGYALNMMPNTGSGDDLSGDVIPAGFSTKTLGTQYGAYGFLGAGASTGTGAAITGEVYRFNFAAGVSLIDFIESGFTGTSEFNIGGQAVNVVGYSISTVLVPEPATMAILGLGGLFLARRKK